MELRTSVDVVLSGLLLAVALLIWGHYRWRDRRAGTSRVMFLAVLPFAVCFLGLCARRAYQWPPELFYPWLAAFLMLVVALFAVLLGLFEWRFKMLSVGTAVVRSLTNELMESGYLLHSPSDLLDSRAPLELTMQQAKGLVHAFLRCTVFVASRLGLLGDYESFQASVMLFHKREPRNESFLSIFAAKGLSDETIRDFKLYPFREVPGIAGKCLSSGHTCIGDHHSLEFVENELSPKENELVFSIMSVPLIAWRERSERGSQVAVVGALNLTSSSELNWNSLDRNLVYVVANIIALVLVLAHRVEGRALDYHVPEQSEAASVAPAANGERR